MRGRHIHSEYGGAASSTTASFGIGKRRFGVYSPPSMKSPAAPLRVTAPNPGKNGKQLHQGSNQSARATKSAKSGKERFWDWLLFSEIEAARFRAAIVKKGVRKREKFWVKHDVLQWS